MSSKDEPQAESTAKSGGAEAKAQASPPDEDVRKSGNVESSAMDSSSEKEEETVEQTTKTQPEITGQSVIAPSPGLRTINADEDIVVVDLLHDSHYRLNETGAFIWRKIEREEKVQRIAESLADKYEIGKDQALQHTLAFVEEMAEEGVVAPVE